MDSASGDFSRWLRDHLPLEQGLRRTNCRGNDSASDLRDHLPAEQGLRHIERCGVFLDHEFRKDLEF